MDKSLFDNIHSIVTGMVRHRYNRLPENAVEFNDLYQEGMLAALKLLPKYDKSRGYTLSAFLSRRINGAMTDYLRKTDMIPRTHRTRIRLVQQRQEMEAQKTGLPVPLHLFADSKEVKSLIYVGHCVLSLSNKAGNSAPDDTKIEDVLASDAQDPFEAVADAHLFTAILKAIFALPERTRNILILYYDKELSLRTIGDDLGISESRVSQIKTAACYTLGRVLNGAP